MTRIAVIGNSHTGALMWAWHETVEQARPDIEVDFFRGHWTALGMMNLTGDKRFGFVDMEDDPELMVHTMKLNMRLSIDLSRYDVVLSVGWWFTDPGLIQALVRHFNIDGLSHTVDGNRLSATAFDAILKDQVNENLPDACWHNWAAPRLFHIGMPRRNEALLDLPSDQGIDRSVLPQALDRLSQLYAARLADLGITNIPQPAKTIGSHGLSLSQYGRDANKPDQPQRPDYAHMNADYGRLFWADIFETVGC